MKQQKGFSMVELLMVVTIIGILMAVAIPGLRRAKQNAQMGSAVQSMRVIYSGEAIYLKKYNVYGTLTELGTELILDQVLSSGDKEEYTFEVTVGATGKTYTVTGSPKKDLSRMDYFFLDESGVIRFNKGAPADVTSQPIPR